MGSLGHCGSPHLSKADASGWIEVMSQTVWQKEKAIKGKLRKISTGWFARLHTSRSLSNSLPNIHDYRQHTRERTINHIIQQISYHTYWWRSYYLIISTNFPCISLVLTFITQPSWWFYTSPHVWSVAKLSNLFSNLCFTTKLMPLTVRCYLSPASVKWVTLFR